MTRKLLLVAAFALLAASCAKKDVETVTREAPIRGVATSTPAPAVAPQAGGGKAAQGVALDVTPCPPVLSAKPAPANAKIVLQVAKQVFERNEDVPMRLTIANSGSDDLRRRWGKDQPDWDLWVSYNGQVVWRSFHASDNRGAAGDRIYTSGEQRQQDETWKNEYCKGDIKQQRDRAPGSYTAQGYFADFDGAWYSNTVQFQVR